MHQDSVPRRNRDNIIYRSLFSTISQIAYLEKWLIWCITDLPVIVHTFVYICKYLGPDMSELPLSNHQFQTII